MVNKRGGWKRCNNDGNVLTVVFNQRQSGTICFVLGIKLIKMLMWIRWHRNDKRRGGAVHEHDHPVIIEWIEFCRLLALYSTHPSNVSISPGHSQAISSFAVIIHTLSTATHLCHHHHHPATTVVVVVVATAPSPPRRTQFGSIQSSLCLKSQCTAQYIHTFERLGGHHKSRTFPIRGECILVH